MVFVYSPLHEYLWACSGILNNKKYSREEEMVEEKEEMQQEKPSEKKPKKGKLKLLIILIVALTVLGGGGFFAYTKFFSHKSGSSAEAGDAVADEESALFSLTPFVLNLTNRGRFLKVTMNLELTDKKYEAMAKEKIAPIRDAIITLISSKTAESISTPEGKFQMKDELLMRANAAVGKDVFKNVYFTEFVMQ